MTFLVLARRHAVYLAERAVEGALTGKAGAAADIGNIVVRGADQICGIFRAQSAKVFRQAHFYFVAEGV